MDLETLSIDTVSFVRTYCNLEKPNDPMIFSDEYPLKIDHQQVAYFRRVDPTWMPQTHGCKVFDAYKEMQSLDTKPANYAKKILNSWIQNSEEFIVLDIGAGFGQWLWDAAKENPNAQFYLTDMFSFDKVREEQDRTKAFPIANLDDSLSGEDQMNALLSENGYENITYLHNQSAIEEGRVESIREIAGPRRVFVSGIRSPGSLQLATANESIYQEAERVVITPSAFDKTTPEHIEYYLQDSSLSKKEIKGVIERVLDPEGTKESRKIDYKIKGHSHLGIALKQLFVIELAKKLQKNYDVDINLVPSDNVNGFNQPDHIVTGVRP